MILRNPSKGEIRDFPKVVAVFKKGTHETLLTQAEIDELFEQLKSFAVSDVGERYFDIYDAATLIKSMPIDQAVQKMKSTLSEEPETTVIEGELLVSFHNAR